MVTKRPIPFSITPKGRNIAFSLVAGSTVALSAAQFGAHTFFVNYYKDFVQFYSDGQPAAVPMYLQERCNKCMDLLKLPDVHKKLISPFRVYGYDLFHAGTTFSKFGVAIGIPVNFTYKSVEDMEKDNLQINQKKVDFTTDAGQKLADSLLLPEKVQEYALCREILMTNNYKVMLDATYPFVCIFSAYTFTQWVNQKFQFYSAPRMLRLCLYSLVSGFTVGCYYLLKDMTQIYYETETDKKLASMGPEFIENGITFYEKLLKRNQVLRELMGKEGETRYSVKGNENYLLRQPHIALIHRKKFFEEQLKNSQDSPGIQEANNVPKSWFNFSM